MGDSDFDYDWLVIGSGFGGSVSALRLAEKGYRVVLRHPALALRAMRVRAWSRRTVILLVMQTLEGAMRLKVARRWPNGNVVLTTEQDPDNPNPDKIPTAYRAAEWIQSKLGGASQAMFTEAMLSIPTTAHILGGAVIGADPQTGVIDDRHRVFGYHDLLVCDGAAVPANIGVNPSLTITALAERAMTHIPPKGSPTFPAAADGRQGVGTQ
jgi:cholesterol oxidase